MHFELCVLHSAFCISVKLYPLIAVPLTDLSVLLSIYFDFPENVARFTEFTGDTATRHSKIDRAGMNVDPIWMNDDRAGMNVEPGAISFGTQNKISGTESGIFHHEGHEEPRRFLISRRGR